MEKRVFNRSVYDRNESDGFSKNNKMTRPEDLKTRSVLTLLTDPRGRRRTRVVSELVL